MNKLPIILGERLARVLIKIGFEKVRQKGSHLSLLKRAPEKTYKVVVPLHSSLAKGTLHDILKQAGLSKEDLIRLL